MFTQIKNLLEKNAYFLDHEEELSTGDSYYEFKCETGYDEETNAHHYDNITIISNNEDIVYISVSVGRYICKFKTARIGDYSEDQAEFNHKIYNNLEYLFNNLNECYHNWESFDLVA